MAKPTSLPFQRARQPEQIEERREAILDAALVLFQEKGLENVTLVDIGRVVGTAKSNLYRYFESREHIYLVVLQQQGAAWEKKVVPRLEKLAGRASFRQVAEVIADSLAAAEAYSQLISVTNGVLEKNLPPALVASFRSVFFERRRRLARAIAKALPKTAPEKIDPLVLPIFAQVSGLWPLCHPSPATKKMLATPEYAHLQLDFEAELSRFIRLILKGALK